MALTLYSFNSFLTMVQNALASASPQKITNLLSGSIANALAQASTGAAMALQNVCNAVYISNRLATAVGADAVTFVADYGMTPLPATQATQQVTLTRANTIGELDISISSANIVQTPVNNIQFTPYPDTTQVAWDPVRSLYYFGNTQQSITITVQALPQFVGSLGNCAAGAISQIVSGFAGVNTVTNPLAVVNGQDAETIPALKARFPEYIASLPSACNAAITDAIESTQTGLTWQILDTLHANLTTYPAGFTVVVDDGTGAIPSKTLTQIYQNVLVEKAAGIEFYPTDCQAPTNVPVNVTTHINTVTGGSLAGTQANVQAALTTYINTLGVGVPVNYAALENVIQAANGVFSYSGTLLNGAGTNVNITLAQLARMGTMTFV